MRNYRVLDKTVTTLKIRIALMTFKIRIAEIAQFARERKISDQRERFTKRLKGMKRKEEVRKEKEIVKDLKGIEIRKEKLETIAAEQKLEKVENYVVLGDIEITEVEKEFLKVHYKCRQLQKMT